MWYRESIAEIPLLLGGGGVAPPLRMLSLFNGETHRTQLAMLRHQKPIARSLGGYR